jgi:hypothetical protein
MKFPKVHLGKNNLMIRSCLPPWYQYPEKKLYLGKPFKNKQKKTFLIRALPIAPPYFRQPRSTFRRRLQHLAKCDQTAWHSILLASENVLGYKHCSFFQHFYKV